MVLSIGCHFQELMHGAFQDPISLFQRLHIDSPQNDEELVATVEK